MEPFDHEGIHTEYIAMVGHSDSQLVERCNLLDQQLDLICTIEKIELGPEVEEEEERSHGEILYGEGEGKSNQMVWP